MANYKDIYNKAYADLEDQFNVDKQALDDAQVKEKAAMDEQKRAADTRLLDTRNEALRQAYISRRQNERSMPGMMAAQGLTGGPSETAIASVMRGYQNTRNTANKQYSGDQTTLDTDYSANIATLGSKYAQLLQDLRNQRNADALARAQIEYTAAVQREQNAAAPAVSSSGGGGGSGGGGISTNDNNAYIETGGAQRDNSITPTDYKYSYKDPDTGKWVYVY